ncbi:MAG: hypothetical protein EXQ77_00250 [Thermoleophilia bacterium]|nr:hypothetical protein [Thermoleophilia bacterium]
MPSRPATPFYVFDGSNLFHAGGFASREKLVDALATFVALEGARGRVVFDGVGADREVGLLEVRFAPDADPMIERTVADRRAQEQVVVVTSDREIRMASGVEVRKVHSADFVAALGGVSHTEERRSLLSARIDPETRARLEQLRRGQ